MDYQFNVFTIHHNEFFNGFELWLMEWILIYVSD